MLVIVKGLLGSGKTLLLTIFAYFSTQNIYSNYDLNFKKKKVNEFSLSLLFSKELSNANVFIDEIYTLADSRDSMSNMNRILPYMHLQSRKRGINFFGSLQMLSMLDIRLRTFIDIIIECYNNEQLEQFEYVMRFKNNYKLEFVITYENAKRFFEFYDTYQIITNKKVDSLKYSDLSNNLVNSLVLENIERFIKFKKEYIGNKRITKDFIKFACKELELPDNSDFRSALYYEYEKYMKENNKKKGS